MGHKRKNKKPVFVYDQPHVEQPVVNTPPPPLPIVFPRTEETIEQIFGTTVPGIKEDIKEKRMTACWGASNKSKK